jgi:hypothetical protein
MTAAVIIGLSAATLYLARRLTGAQAVFLRKSRG